MVIPRLPLFVAAVLATSWLPAAEVSDYYKLLTLDQPQDLTLEVGGLAKLPGGKLAVAIRRGEVWIAQNPYAENGAGVQWKRFANGLHEPLGLALHEGDLYTCQRGEITRLRDTDNDGVADEYLCAAKGWGVSGAYHEYAYGPKFDPKGNMWITLNCSMGDKFVPEAAWRGYSIRVKPDGSWKPVSGGMRSPCGIGVNEAGDVFFTEQQGNWNSAGGVYHIKQGVFHGHADSFASCNLPDAPFQKPAKPVNHVLVPEVSKQMPIYQPPAIWLPYRKMGMSTTDLALDTTGGKFGPFAGQFFIGEFTMSQVNRIFMEKVDGEYQGACFPFMEGFQSAPLRMEFGDDGSMFVGETNRGWNSLGSRSYGLQRIVWSGKTPFEFRTMEAKPKGFRCTFTKPVQRESVTAQAFRMSSYTYEYRSEYGGLEIDTKDLVIKVTSVAADGLSAELEVEGLRAGYIHELTAPGVRSADGESLLHPFAYYTLNRIPSTP